MPRYYQVVIILLAMSVPAMAGATEIFISGKIVDRAGNPVPGVHFTTSGPLSLPHPLSVPGSRLFPGVPADCLQFSLSNLQTNSQGDYRLRVMFIPGRGVHTLPPKTCADYQNGINRANMKLVPVPEDVRKYDLVQAHGPLPVPTQRTINRNAGSQVRSAGQPALPGGLAPR